MLRYQLAAAALKALSASSWSRTFYREVIGNRFGARRRLRAGLNPGYVRKAALLLDTCRRHAVLRDGMRFLEVGTGWMHFYAIVVRLVSEARGTLVDVTDNRQLDALKAFVRELDATLERALTLRPEELERAHRVLAQVAEAETYEELYRRLGFDYRVDASGLHRSLAADSFDLVFSFDVLEHVHRNDIPAVIGNLQRVLKPGGIQIHDIGINDHLAAFDPKVSAKHYLRYPESTWRRYFQNDLQYINRVQRSEWLGHFSAAGAELVEEQPFTCDITGLEVHPQFARFSPLDLACIALFVVHRKPAGTPPARR